MTADTEAGPAPLIPAQILAPAAAGGGGAARRNLLLSTMAAGPRENRPATIALILLVVAFAAMAPFAKMPWIAAPAFIPAYESALVITDLITSLLLFGQFIQLRSPGVLVLAAGYLFDGLMIVVHSLFYPGVFAPTGLLGAGMQSTPWIYMLWHGGFPIFVMAYIALQPGRGSASGPGDAALGGRHVLAAIAGVFGIVTLCVLATTWGRGALPDLLVDNTYTGVYRVVVLLVWGLSLGALFALWRRRDKSALDTWLVVVMVAWLADIALGAVLNGGRWDVGFYGGRAYGLLAASFVLAMILLETSGLYSRLARVAVRLEDKTQRLEADVRGRIIEQRQTEAQLRQAQKMEALGNLTGGMAHDFNNVLGALILNLETLGTLVEPKSEAAELVEMSLEATLHGAELTRHLLAFARRQSLQPQRVEVNGLIAELTRFLSRTLGEHIAVSLELASDLWPVVADPTQVESSLTNLANNARDAMPEGGRLSIVTANRTLDADYAAEHEEVSAGDYALIQVTDSGTGMSQETLARVFEPFFTTKGPGKGSGLGLAMVFGFIKQSGGHINVYSEVGVGTTFRLYLPRDIAAAEAAAPEEAPAVAVGRGETVLVVEDNAGLRRVATRQLRELNYRVLEADTAAVALALLESESADLLFTDVVMPGGMSGVALAEIAAERWPAMRVLLTSGFPDPGNGNGDPLPAVCSLLGKPYRRADLGQAIRRALDE